MERYFGAGLLGRQVASAGSTVVGNEMAGRGSLDQVAFGLDLLRVCAGRAVAGGGVLRVDAPATALALYGAVSSPWSMDLGGEPVLPRLRLGGPGGDGERSDAAGNVYY